MPTPLRSTKGRIRSVACERGDYAPLSTFQTTCAKRWEIVVCLRWNRAGVGRPVARRRDGCRTREPHRHARRGIETLTPLDVEMQVRFGAAARSASPLGGGAHLIPRPCFSRIRYQIASSDPSSCSAMQRSNILSIAPTSYSLPLLSVGSLSNGSPHRSRTASFIRLVLLRAFLMELPSIDLDGQQGTLVHLAEEKEIHVRTRVPHVPLLMRRQDDPVTYQRGQPHMAPERHLRKRPVASISSKAAAMRFSES